MFKIESYVTPIILNYVAKYVKNIRPQDAQVSLWEGEVVFQNLDLRLDVLEEELNLPFEFLSGHIHELSIRVPWTKITSEPIRIEINTIEFVLKLKDEHTDGAGSSATSSPQRSQRSSERASRKLSKSDGEHNAHQTSGGLVNKIINNISLQCHNIILKYVEEDIVVSMNVQLLSFGAADDHWKFAMIDVHPSKVMLRKLVHISDLTICLDKRNATGQIDVCQEPLLYRSTLECRILRKYNIHSIATSSTTRIGISTKALDMNISALQFPMAMRIFKLITALKNGGLKSSSSSEVPCDDEANEPEHTAQSDGSYLSWAWNLLPSFNFPSPEEEEPTDIEQTGHMVDIGVYVEQFNFTLKNYDFVSDTIMSTTKRIRYTPIIRISLMGTYFERTATVEHNWSSMKAGVTRVHIEPLGIYRNDDQMINAIVESARCENEHSYMDKSLFDEQYLLPDKGWGVANYEEYATHITDEYLLYRTPVLALDMIEYKEAARDEPSGTDALQQCEKETCMQYRLLSSGFTFRYGDAFLQVKHIVNEFVKSYDYPAYYAERPDATVNAAIKLHPPLMEDYDALMQHIPLRTFKFGLKKVRLEVHAKTEPTAVQKTQQRRFSCALRNSLPYFSVYLEQAEGSLTTPLEPDKLVHTTCQLPDKPPELLGACYENYQLHLKDFSLALVTKTGNQNFGRLLVVPKLQLTCGQLLQPELWKSEDIPVRKLDGVCEKFIVEITKQELITSERLLSCVLRYRPQLLSKMVRLAAVRPQKEPIRLQNEFAMLRVLKRRYKQHRIWNVSLRGLQASVVTRRSYEDIKHVVFTTTPKTHNQQSKWLEWQAQFPVVQSSTAEPQVRVAMGFWVERFQMLMDSSLVQFLQYQEEPEPPPHGRETLAELEIQSQNLQTLVVTTALNAAPIAPQGSSLSLRRTPRNVMPARKISHPEETIHVSSERDERVDVEPFDSANTQIAAEAQHMDWVKFAQSLIFYVEIAQGRLDIANTFSRASTGEFLSEYTEVRLPMIICKSTHAEYIARSNTRLKMVVPTVATLNWKVTLKDFSIQNNTLDNTYTILEPIQTSVTIALTHKHEKVKATNKLQLESVKKRLAKKKHSDFNTIKQTKSRELRKASPNSEEVASTSADGRTSTSEDTDFNVNAASNVSIAFKKSDEEKEVLAPVSSSKKAVLKDVITLTLHADTSTIHFFVSSEKVKILNDHLQIFLRVLELFQTVAQLRNGAEQEAPEPIKILTAAEEDTSIKEFLELETNSETSKATDDKNDSLFVASLFCQWTVTKIIVELETAEIPNRTKMILELEDILSTIDKHEDFSKYTSKMGGFSLNYYEPSPKGEWLAHECLRMKIFGDNANLPFFNVIYTSVGLKSFYSKIGVKRKGDLSRNISEILVTMQAMEVIIDLDRITEFVSPICVLFERKERKMVRLQSNQVQCKQTALSASDLPLIHLDCKGFTMYMPLDTEKQCCSVLIWKIEGIKVTPNLENPLQRIPLRPDVYSKAAQMGILSTPGALVEDRQYELTLQSISAASGNWSQILSHMREQSNNFHRTNPAFEWNNQNRKTALQLTDLFNNFKFVTIYAPTIVYNNILICGHSLEFNCASDFIASVNTYQLNLLSCIIVRLQNISKIVANSYDGTAGNLPSASTVLTVRSATSVAGTGRLTTAKDLPRTIKSLTSFYSAKSMQQQSSLYMDPCGASTFDSIDEDTEQNFKTDSGFQSAKSRLVCPSACLASMEHFTTASSSSSLALKRKDKPQCNVPERHVPYTVSLVAGIFIVKIFDVLRAEDKVKEFESEPLLSFTITQPNFMSTQNIYDSVMQVSIFNIKIHLADTEAAPRQSAQMNLFPNVLLETRSGVIGETGIPPSLCSFKVHRTKTQQLEIDVEWMRPILIKFSERSAQQVCKTVLLIYDALLENPCFNVCNELVVPRGTKIKLLRQQVLNADRLQLKCFHVTVKFADADFNYKLYLNDSQLNVKFLNRPEKIVLKGSMGSLYMHAGKKVVLHPLTLRYAVDFVSEPWHRLPLVVGTVKLNVLRVDVSINSLVHMRLALQGFERITAFANSEWQQFLKRHQEQRDASMTAKQLTLLKCPPLNNRKPPRNSRVQREEFYQDDLRAGAFQFVELATDSFLPLPYQIQVIKQNYGIICWRYPQPRTMCRIHIYPVPMPVTNPVQIKCRMEYFSEVHECFLHYCDFWLSETVSKQIVLPQREICANIWRVVILQSLVSVNGECFDTSEEDEEVRSIASMKITDVLHSERKESDFILHPKVLVGCMRIDTAFQSDSVPKVQLLVSCNLFQVKLLNQPTENVDLPSLLKKFRLAHVSPISQTFAELLFERLNFHASLYTLENYALESSMNCQIKCLDYGFLNMLYLLEPSTFQSYVRFNKPQRTVDVNVVLDKFRLNLGPTIVHSLLSSKLHWDELLDEDRNRKRHAVIPKCLVVNRTMSQLSFGQTGTTERIQLQPRECHLYSFRSDYHNQELTFFVADSESRITEVSQSVAIPFKFDGDVMLQPIRIGNKCLIIKSKRLSAAQIYVFIKGQIELLSMVAHDFRIEFRSEGKLDNEKHLQEYMIEENARSSFYRSVHRNSNIMMRLRFANSKGKGRSGDIPLKANKNLPWLVKVPTHHNNDFISFWVRIVREDIPEASNDKFQPQKVLITIWPIFIIGSMLSCSVDVLESSTANSLCLNAHGTTMELSVPATHLTEHKINFQYGFTAGAKTTPDYTLSLKAMEWNKFFYYDEQRWTVEYTLQELAKRARAKWPLADDEELRVQRRTNLAGPVDVQYKCMPSREFSCALCLEASPWGIFINASGVSISIRDCATHDCLTVDSNCLEMMFSMEHGFTIGLANSTNWLPSLPIFYDQAAAEAKGGRYLLLSEHNFLDILTMRAEEVLKFVLELKVEDGRRIFKLRPKFVAANFTSSKLCLLAFAMDHKESASIEDVAKLDERVQKYDLQPVKYVEESIGFTLDAFDDVHARKATRSKDTAFVCFVCVKVCQETNFSIPIPLSMPFTRRCFSIPHGTDSMPLLVTLSEKDGVYYLSIFNDSSPAILIDNQTNVKFIIAQTSASENSKVSNTTPEYDGRHFEWFQLLLANSKCYYTPPEMYANFPDVESTTCNLTLALYKDGATKKTIKWSKPIRTDKTWEKFLHVPNHGDVKVIICDKHRVIKVAIYYIAQQLEFSVKDLRSRLLTPLSVPSATGDHSHSTGSINTLEAPSVHGLKPLPSAMCMHFSQEPDTKMQYKVRFYAKEMVFGLHTDAKERDYIKCEVFSLYMDDLVLAYDDNDDQRQLNLLIPNMQMDNQLYSTGKYDFPVILCAQGLYTRSVCLPLAHELNTSYQNLRSRNPMALLTLNFYEDELKLDSINCKLSPLRAYIEDAYLNDLLEALLECEPSNCVYRPKQDFLPVALLAGQTLLPRDIVAEATCIAEPLQLRSFRIEPLTVLLSVHTSVRMYIALDHSPLSFSTYERQRILTMPLRFGQSVGMHFLSGAIFGAGWVVGSLEILGSPSGLARSFSTGLRDFVSMPVQGLFRGPWGFIVGITQGSASLLRNVTAGTVNSVSKLAASVARNLDRLSLDPEHIERTEALRRCRPRGFAEGFSQGMTGLGISILGAVGGIAHHTLEARSPSEVITGMGRGLVGAFTKPLSGAAELLALTGQGMLHTVGYNAMPLQRAPSVCHNVAVGPAAYRLWKLLPPQLISDQILFYHEVTLVVQEQMRRGYVFLTSAVFTVLEAQWDRLALVLPIKKVEMTCDREDKTLIYVRMVHETDDLEEDMSYTNQRIMSFLRSSFSVFGLNSMTTDSFDDLLQSHDQSHGTDCAFYINEHSGEHLMQYLNIISHHHD